MVRQNEINDGVYALLRGRPRLFCADCELDHICPRRDRPLCSSPDGVSQFQCPGLARSLAVYCADGLVFSVPVSSETPPASAPDTRRLVICLQQSLLAECATISSEEIHHERRPLLTSDIIGLTKIRAVFAPRLHDRVRRHHRRQRVCESSSIRCKAVEQACAANPLQVRLRTARCFV